MKPVSPVKVSPTPLERSRLALSAVLLVVFLAVACEGAAAAELARGEPLGATFEPIGFDGADVIVRQEERVLAFGPAGRRIIVQDAGLRAAVAGGGTLALARLRGGRLELLAGPVAGPWPVVLSCPAGDERPSPALAGGVVLWQSCDGLRVLAFTPVGQVTYDAGGRVRAIAGDGNRIAWVAEDAADGEHRVFTRALADPATALFGTLGTGAEEALLSVAVAQDGRVRASRMDLEMQTTCTTVGDGAGAQRRVSKGLCPRRVTFTDEGSVESLPFRDGSQRVGIVRRSRSGAVLSTIATYSRFSIPRPFATDGVRIATSLLTCLGSRLVEEPLATARFAKPSCPIRPTSRTVTATRTGVVRIRVRCPQGCMAVPNGMDLRLGNRASAVVGETFLDLPAGSSSARITFRLSRGQLRGLRRRGTVTGRVSINGYEERTRFSVRVRAPR